MFVTWASLAPNASSHVRPSGFKASDPTAYPAASWTIYDTIIRDATARGIGIDLTLTSPGPAWATAPGAPPGPTGVWKPSAPDFGAFVQAVATRYSGSYNPYSFNSGSYNQNSSYGYSPFGYYGGGFTPYYSGYRYR